MVFTTYVRYCYYSDNETVTHVSFSTSRFNKLTEVGSGEYIETEYFMLPVVSSGGSILYFCRNKALTGNTKVVLLIPNRVKVLTGRHASVMTTR